MGKLGGRPRKQGERYSSNGNIKPIKQRPFEGLAPALLGRIKNVLLKKANDPRLAELVGVLWVDGEFTNAQAAAAYKIGDIYRAYHRAKSLREHPKAPNWERGFGSADLAEERMSPEQLQNHEEWIRKAEDAWRKVDEFFTQLRRELRQAIIDVCVFSTPCNPTLLPDLRAVLDELAKRWAPGWQQRALKLGDSQVLREGPRTSAHVHIQRPKRRDTISEPLDAVLKAIRPDLDEDERKLVVETFHALRDRAEFQRSKQKL